MAAAGMARTTSRSAVTGLALLAAAFWTTGAAAAPLDAEACDKLQQEQSGLVKAGARQIMAKGAAWAAGNLTQDKLAEIQRLIEVDEQIEFRCTPPRAAKPAEQAKAPPAAAPAPATDKAGAKAPAPAVKASAQAKAASPKPQPAGAGKAGKADAKATAPAAKAAASKAARPKANDAYVPPPKLEEAQPWWLPEPAQQ